MAGWGPDTEWFPASVVLLAAPTAVAGYIVGAVQRHLSRHGAPPAEIAASVAAGAFYFLAGTAALVLAAGALIPLPRALAWEVTALAAAFGAPAGGAVGSWGGSWIARARRRGSPAPGAALAGAIVLGAALPHVLLALPTRCFEPAPAPAVAMAALALVGLGAALGALAAERAVGATAGARGMAMGLAAGAALLLLALAGGRMPALRFHLTPASTLAARHDVAGLQRRMRDPDGLASAQAHACFAPLLSGTRDRADVQLLLSELRSPRPDHQMAAAQGLGRIGDRSVVQPLLELGGRSKDGTVLKAVATALGQLADRRAAPFLVTLLSWQGDAYQTPQVRAEAAAALERLEAPSDPAVRAGLAAYRRDLWLAEGFARDEPMPPELRGDPTVVDALIGKLRTDPNSPSESWKRSHVVKTLGGLRSPKIVPALRPLVTDPDILVRQAAFDVLVERDVETCLAAMAREDGERRHAAVRTAANFRDARIAPALLKLLDDPALRE
jgi:HEAT repeat protein